MIIERNGKKFAVEHSWEDAPTLRDLKKKLKERKEEIDLNSIDEFDDIDDIDDIDGVEKEQFIFIYKDKKNCQAASYYGDKSSLSKVVPLALCYEKYLKDNYEKYSDDITYLVFEKIDENETFWLCGIESGLVKLDVIIHGKDKADEILIDQIKDPEDDGSKLVFIGGGYKAIDIDTSDFFKNKIVYIDEKDLLVEKIVGRYERLNTSSVTISNTVIILTACIASYLLFSYSMDIYPFGDNTADKNRKKIQHQTAILKTYNHRLLMSVDINKAIIDAHNILSKIVDKPNYWPYKKVNCNYDSQVCSIFFLNKRSRSVDNIKKYLRRICDDSSIDSKGEVATCRMSILMENRKSLPAKDYSPLINFMLENSKAGGMYSMENPKPSKVSGTTLAPNNIRLKEGDWKLTNGFITVYNILHHHEIPSWVKVKEFNISAPTKNSNFRTILEVRGVYVTK